jgi:Uma2 family endonuclease
VSTPYQEVLYGETLMRRPPGPRHELLCQRLHSALTECLQFLSTSRLLAPRSAIELQPGTFVRPDLVLVTVATGKPWLIGEVIDSEDHHTDTVLKKSLYEDSKLPRLWMIDPRYDNVEIYHGTAYGLSLKHILARREQLTESLLPELNLGIGELFSAGADEE